MPVTFSIGQAQHQFALSQISHLEGNPLFDALRKGQAPGSGEVSPTGRDFLFIYFFCMGRVGGNVAGEAETQEVGGSSRDLIHQIQNTTQGLSTLRQCRLK